jgi:hypothetical protein
MLRNALKLLRIMLAIMVCLNFIDSAGRGNNDGPTAGIRHVCCPLYDD